MKQPDPLEGVVSQPDTLSQPSARALLGFALGSPGRVERIAEVLLAVSDLPDDEVETMLTQRAARAPGP